MVLFSVREMNLEQERTSRAQGNLTSYLLSHLVNLNSNKKKGQYLDLRKWSDRAKSICNVGDWVHKGEELHHRSLWNLILAIPSHPPCELE